MTVYEKPVGFEIIIESFDLDNPLTIHFTATVKAELSKIHF